jgi:hypothetical protein
MSLYDGRRVFANGKEMARRRSRAASKDSGRICEDILKIAAILKFPVVHKTGAGQRINQRFLKYVKNGSDCLYSRLLNLSSILN